MEPGDTSQPIKSDFGYHIIQVTERRHPFRASRRSWRIKLKADPDSFADSAKDLSDDYGTAGNGGAHRLGAPLPARQQRRRRDLRPGDPGDVSDPVPSTGEYTIYKVDDAAENRYATKSARDKAKGGFDHWLDRLKADVGFWLDAEFLPTTTAVG